MPVHSTQAGRDKSVPRTVTFENEPASPSPAVAATSSTGQHSHWPRRPRHRPTWREDAVAAQVSRGEDSEEDSDSQCESLCVTSIAGDSVVDSSDAEGKDKTPTAVAARRQARAAPSQLRVGSVSGEHAIRNSEPEVGNFGIYLGNWGARGSVKEGEQARRRKNMDRQLVKNPGQLVILLESTPAQVDLLEATAVAGEEDGEGLDARPTHEHWVIRGKEDGAILAAARKDTSFALECLLYELHEDHPYTKKGKANMARSRSMILKYMSKQNVGHLGREIVVMGSHGNNLTMRIEWRKAWENWWDRHAQHIRNHEVKFWCADFNMSLTEVPKQLRSRGIVADCCAWYPWKHINPGVSVVEDMQGSTPLGIDSMGIFYIGGTVGVTPSYGLAAVDDLTAVADSRLHVYEGENVPGKHWSCYRSDAEPPPKKSRVHDLKQRLVDLLTPTCTQQELDAIPRQSPWHFCPYLRVKQKDMSQDAWLLPDGKLHHGAHFPLCIFTNNASQRSRGREIERAKRKGKGKGKGKGKARDIETAVAERPPLHDSRWREDARWWS